MSTAKKKTTPKKKPAGRPIPPPPPGWEIVGKDDPRLKKLPCRPMACYPAIGEWCPSIYDRGEFVPGKTDARYALPIAQPPAPQPPMIRLRLPSEKPTREDGDIDGDIVVFFEDGVTNKFWNRPLGDNVIFWIPGSLPDGILPREPSQEEKWEAEAEIAYSKLLETTRPNLPGFIDGFLAAKKGGAE